MSRYISGRNRIRGGPRISHHDIAAGFDKTDYVETYLCRCVMYGR